MSNRQHPEIWKAYWDLRRQRLEASDGKRRAAARVCALIEAFPINRRSQLRVLELGCGEGHVLKVVADYFADALSPPNICGLDKNCEALRSARFLHPGFTFFELDLVSPGWDDDLGTFDVIYAVNTLHEIFSSSRYPEREFIDTARGKQVVKDVISSAASLVSAGGYLLIFDGVEYQGDLEDRIQFRIIDDEVSVLFDKFIQEYRAHDIIAERSCSKGGEVISLSKHDFTRFITKLRWINTKLWDIERWESYQYFSGSEFIDVFRNNGLEVVHEEFLSPDVSDWQSSVEIEYGELGFPYENILMVGTRVE